jgi:two-component system phosphate regulon sensor histidine kinase PhoR
MLINDVLDFQKLEAGRMKLNMQANDINKIVEEVHKAMALSAKKKGVDFSIELDDNLPKASFDSDKIIQVLTNLVSNAIKFTPKHGRVSVTARCRSEELVIRVSDTGMGIPSEALPKIFGRFYRVHRPGKQIQGTGLGLAIVKGIVMMHSGRIEVESEVDRGTTFTVFLPLTTKAVKEEHLPAKKDEHLESTLVNNQARKK